MSVKMAILTDLRNHFENPLDQMFSESLKLTFNLLTVYWLLE